MEVDGDTIVVSMSESSGLELPEFVKWAQVVTKRVFTFNENEMMNQAQGGSRVTFLGSLRFKRATFDKDFFSFFQTMLYIKGFAIVPRGEGDLEILEIISTKRAAHPRGHERRALRHAGRAGGIQEPDGRADLHDGPAQAHQRDDRQQRAAPVLPRAPGRRRAAVA